MKKLLLFALFLPFNIHAWFGLLMRAYEEGRERRALQVMKVLKDNEGVNDKIDGDSTPLAFAAGENDINLVKKFLEMGAKTDVIDPVYESPLHTAVNRTYPQVVETLLLHNADPNIKDSYWSPCHLIVNTIHKLPLEQQDLNDRLKILKLLFAYKADPNLSIKEVTPFFAVYETFEKLFNQVSPADQFICRSQFQPIFNEFIKAGADLSLKDKKGRTALELLQNHYKFSPTLEINPLSLPNTQSSQKIEAQKQLPYDNEIKAPAIYGCNRTPRD